MRPRITAMVALSALTHVCNAKCCYWSNTRCRVGRSFGSLFDVPLTFGFDARLTLGRRLHTALLQLSDKFASFSFSRYFE